MTLYVCEFIMLMTGIVIGFIISEIKTHTRDKEYVFIYNNGTRSVITETPKGFETKDYDKNGKEIDYKKKNIWVINND